ncbi:hypothetical protein [Promicromonospora soli]
MTATIVYLPTGLTPPLTPDSTHSIPDPVPDPRHVEGWLPIDVEFFDQSRALIVGAHAVAPVLDALCARHGGQWWFVNQQPGWRVYLQDVPVTEAAVALDRPLRSGHRGSWTANLVAPQKQTAPAQTSGVAGQARSRSQVLGDLHCSDSRGALDYLRDRPLLAPRHVAGILTPMLCRAAGLADISTADFVDRHWLHAAQLDEPTRARAQGLTEMLGSLLRTPATRLLELDSYGARWAAGLTHAGERLGKVGHAGFVSTRGEPTPEVVQHDLRSAVAAQWNRLGLSPTEQVVLAVAIRNVLWTRRKKQ